ncbi:hypothetical protein [Desulforhopalus singaporensis]|uniref:HpcH/HpaI aldolase/citrate lyase family protein n=1 Tax=Desulforhopalus singaporensis TaxID=91360 RepID=A0A1H0LF66_9BACT|nr:hypothetical protein [Desulforhopalus singaporensis]SDO66848.1 HpcH/HpaI aldolase/citrate lyase family protein [Desulforhopalus singaporensis]
MSTNLKLFLFAHQRETIEKGVDQGFEDFMVDCEWRGKVERQTGADTDTSFATMAQLTETSSIKNAEINCRINCFGPWTDDEIETAVAAGVTRIFLPMVRTVGEVEHFIRKIDDRAQPMILVETDEAVKLAPQLARLPLAGVYVGLNDLAISRGYRFIFKPIIDGTLDYLREKLSGLAFGFGGVTLLGHGFPIPVELLLAEMHRLDCDFSFLRRSFYRDSKDKDVREEIEKLHRYWRHLDIAERHYLATRKKELDDVVATMVATTTDQC